MVEHYEFAVWGTQGGGLVRWNSDLQRYAFVTAPDCPGLNVGDLMPEEWDTIPANEEAYASEDEASNFSAGLEEFFDILIAKVNDGDIAPEDAMRFLPRDMQDLG